MITMKTKSVATLVLAVAGLAGSASAQAPQPATSPAPAVAAAPNKIIYTPRLPNATELTNVATAQGLTVDRIEQTSTQVTVVYKLASGQTNTVAYQLLPTAGNTPTQSIASPTPAPAMVYEPAPRVYYYDTYGPDYYYPGYWYPPVSLSLGFGFRGGSFHGGFGRGFHHRR